MPHPRFPATLSSSLKWSSSRLTDKAKERVDSRIYLSQFSADGKMKNVGIIYIFFFIFHGKIVFNAMRYMIFNITKNRF